ncbi:MAG: Lrp/AsnC family transcriptional regulator [Xanthomonadales bacterium]|jgi:Lrp/AsnC family leucine-responsive transcriptional regulator|nr:Lrp/AsnC family transcriptional regulator [Xanthomonadales bacterium]
MGAASTPLDRIDRQLLEILQREGRLSAAALAERVSLSASAVQRRLQRLEQGGVIAGYAARLDPASLGLGLTAFVRVQLERHDPGHVQRFTALARDSEEVVACHALTGDMDYLLMVMVPDLAAFNRFLMERLLASGGIRDVNSSFVLATVKAAAALPLPR